jgi:hypothetical protein
MLDVYFREHFLYVARGKRSGRTAARGLQLPPHRRSAPVPCDGLLLHDDGPRVPIDSEFIVR